jgi:hypothetical protein
VLRDIGGLARAGALAAVVTVLAIGIAVGAAGRHPASRPPSTTQIARVMWRTVLVREPMEHFYPSSEPATISDGSGGNLTAEVGTNLPSTDGDGQLVFFWHNNRFVGWDSSVESMTVLQLQSVGPGHFRVTYSNYAPNDPACCPSLIPMSVAYRWSGDRFIAEAPLPMSRPVPGRVGLIR